MGFIDLWNQASITQMVRESTEDLFAQRERIAGQFLPLEPTRMEKIGRGAVKLKAVGRGRGVIADDATPPVFRPELRMEQEAWSLMRYTEMTPIEESLRRQLEINGTDAASQEERDRAGVDIITRIRAIAERQETLSDYHVMQAVLNGQLEVFVANPAGQRLMNRFVIDYEYPDGHLAQTPVVLSDLTNAKPVDYLRAYQQLIKDATGSYGTRFWMRSDIMRYILDADDTKERFLFQSAANFVPRVTEEMLKGLLYEPQQVEFNITDAGWLPESAGYERGEDDKSYWIPLDKLIVRAPDNGRKFGSMYDGLVPVQTAWDDYQYRGPGAQTYRQLREGNLTTFYRWEARRFPMIHEPGRIVVAKVL